MSALRIAALWIFFVWLFIDGLVVFRQRAPAETRADRLSMAGIMLAVWFGLAIAIPALIFWRYFRGRVDDYLLTMEVAADRFARHLSNLRKP